MKRAILWGVTAAILGGSAGFVLGVRRAPSLRAAVQAQQPAIPSQQTSTPLAVPVDVGEGKRIVYTFPDQAAMQEFLTLWQQRQTLVMRMSVLQEYWKAEQASLTTLNQQVETSYGLEPEKNYALDAEKRAIVERPVESPGTEASPSEPAAIYSFASDEEMQTFTTLWQQRQMVVLRMAALQDYWGGDQTILPQLDNTLVGVYNMDVAKHPYTLDNEKRILIEHTVAPAAPLSDLPSAEQPSLEQTPTPAPAQ